ncbi:MAG: MFS transporter, partial [Chloroflexota bacterium]|nr:MFS transporter [Chloroflexota bacterium]
MAHQEKHQPSATAMAGFQALWTASVASYFVYQVMQLLLSLFASHLTRSPVLVAGVTFALTIPTFMFGLFAGALVDRYDRRRLLLMMTVLRLSMFALAWLSALTGYVSLPLLYGVALMLGMTQTLQEPAFAAIVPMVVPPARLERANTWLVSVQNLISLLALPFGGVIASMGVALTMGIGEGCALAALLALLFLRGIFLPSRLVKRHIMIEVLDGLRFLGRQRMLWVIGLMAAVINACWSGYVAILVLYAVAPGPVGLTPFSYGILLMGEGAGGVVGALLAIPVQRWLGRRWAIGLNILGNAAMFAAPALTTNAWIIGGAALLGGIVGPMWTIAAASLLGRVVPTALQGRVNAAYRFLGEGLAAVGPLLGGLLAQVFGLRVAFAVCALLTLLMIVPFFYVITEEAMRQAHNGG